MKKIKFKSLIIKENKNYMAINKPNNFVLKKNLKNYNTIKNLKILFNKNFNFFNNLYKEISGIIIISKNEKFYQKLHNQLINKKITKNYHIILKGIYNFKKKNKLKYNNIVFKTKKIFLNYTLISIKIADNKKHNTEKKILNNLLLKKIYKRKIKPLNKNIIHLHSIKFKNLNDKRIIIKAPYLKNFGILYKYLLRYNYYNFKK